MAWSGYELVSLFCRERYQLESKTWRTNKVKKFRALTSPIKVTTTFSSDFYEMSNVKMPIPHVECCLSVHVIGALFCQQHVLLCRLIIDKSRPTCMLRASGDVPTSS